ncbi:MAG: hypothetical protein ACLFVT_02780 [Syntrophobacteria bacterium]
MRQMRRALVAGVSILAIISLVWASPLFAATEEVELVGTVYAAEWDADDNVTAVVLVTDEGEEVEVSKSGKGAELLKLEAAYVRVTGALATDEYGRKAMTVMKYTIEQ